MRARPPIEVLACVALAVALAACKKDAPEAAPSATTSAAPAQQARPGVAASCDMTKVVGSCTEWAKLSAGLEKRLCQGLTGVYVEGAGAGCPAAGAVGRCALADGETKHYYATAGDAGGFTAAEAEADCKHPELGGKFSPSAP